MDSKSLRFPFCLSPSPYTSTPRASSTSLGSSGSYRRDTLPHHDRFPRASSTYKADMDQKSSHFLSSLRDHSNSDSRSSSSRWKLQSSVTSSSRSYEHPWAESSVSSRTKLTDSEGRFGHSSLLTSTDDGDNKRAKLTYGNRGLYSKAPSTSPTGSTYSSSGLNNARAGVKEKPSEPLEPSWSSSRFLSRSSPFGSKPLASSREAETQNELELRERRTRFQELTSLYKTDRLTSTYAQGARPKDKVYSPCSFTAVRESSPGGNVASTSTSFANRFSVARDYNNRSSSRLLNASSRRASSQEQPSSLRPEALLPPRPAPEGGEPQGRTSTRHLLSRLFSPSPQNSSSSFSSSLSSNRSLDDDSLSLNSDEGARMSANAEPASRRWQANTPGSRQRRADPSPIWENKDRGVAGPRVPLPREPEVESSEVASGGNSSWLSSSLQSRCPPLLSRLRRHARDESAHSSASLSRPQRLLRRWDDLELRAPHDHDEDDDEEQGAVGLNLFGAACPRRQEEEKLPQMEETLVGLAQRRRGTPLQNKSTGPQVGVETALDGTRSKQEKLRIIKERLLLEDSDEDEGDLCRICQMGEESTSNPLIQPCRCTGSLQYVHQDCIKRWLCSKIGSGTDLAAITNCELCKEKLRLNIDNFDIQQLYRTHAQSEYDNFISSGLYLVVLLHFFEQRFSDVLGAVDAAGLFNLVRILPEHMDNLENPTEESDSEEEDDRPSIEFSDLDDDLDEEY
ncbi:E3 ubiquitin-protein ligase MARCH7 isoform X1 [Phyllopteryx taeniolatus]|uniref:E3 ubiquitin-protein ligase MARCH7 isoform X1 n=1 Tax=Phyllopteryx taeniolatus TaxID=161469 RepID=UPI002AD4584D|nr:E3 ubiquitin-protein ligase MARCH7 isoform X1 [Phyllopteryx taeniolatus]XP_061609142.1 E3 ubiquitin-protein ligase MARCH7 isoform X1 [Phyllopteryx taeniolatus]